MFYRLGCLCFRLPEITGGWVSYKHGNITSLTHKNLEEILEALIHFITVFYHEQTGAIIFRVNDCRNVCKMDGVISR